MSDTSNDEKGRDAIPTHIKRAVLMEAGYACVLPTCRFPATEFAHIVPYVQAREHEVGNIIALCPNHHYQYDTGKIDRKAIRTYKLKLRILNERYTRYELRVLALLAEKPAVAVLGEVHAMGLLMDGLIENAKTLVTQSVTITDWSGFETFNEVFVMTFAARLTQKGQEFIDVWKSSSENLFEAL